MSYRYVATLHLLFTFSKPMSADIKSNKEEKTDLQKDDISTVCTATLSENNFIKIIKKNYS